LVEQIKDLSLSQKLDHLDKYIGEVATRYTSELLKPYDLAKGQATDLKTLMKALQQEHSVYQNLYMNHKNAVVYMENKEILGYVQQRYPNCFKADKLVPLAVGINN